MRGFTKAQYRRPFQPLWPGLRPVTPTPALKGEAWEKEKVRFVVGIVPEQKGEFVGYVTEVTKGRAKIREFLDWERKIGKKRD